MPRLEIAVPRAPGLPDNAARRCLSLPLDYSDFRESVFHSVVPSWRQMSKAAPCSAAGGLRGARWRCAASPCRSRHHDEIPKGAPFRCRLAPTGLVLRPLHRRLTERTIRHATLPVSRLPAITDPGPSSLEPRPPDLSGMKVLIHDAAAGDTKASQVQPIFMQPRCPVFPCTLSG